MGVIAFEGIEGGAVRESFGKLGGGAVRAGTFWRLGGGAKKLGGFW